VAASVGGPGDAFARRRLEEATERLHGLAAGLHEARDDLSEATLDRAVGDARRHRRRQPRR